MCMCGEWMVYGDDGDNNGESLIILLFEGIHTFLAFWNFVRRMRCSIFFFRWVSCTHNSTIGHLSIFTSRLTFSFLSRFRALAPFYFLVFFFFSLFFRALFSWDNVASGSNQDNLSIYFTGEKQKYFWLFSPGLGVEYFWVVLEMEWVDICGWYF